MSQFRKNFQTYNKKYFLLKQKLTAKNGHFNFELSDSKLNKKF